MKTTTKFLWKADSASPGVNTVNRPKAQSLFSFLLLPLGPCFVKKRTIIHLNDIKLRRRSDFRNLKTLIMEKYLHLVTFVAVDT